MSSKHIPISIDRKPELTSIKTLLPVWVSAQSQSKATQLQKFLTLAASKRAWGKDQKLLQANLLLVPTSKNYTVLLAMGRKGLANK